MKYVKIEIVSKIGHYIYYVQDNMVEMFNLQNNIAKNSIHLIQMSDYVINKTKNELIKSRFLYDFEKAIESNIELIETPNT